MCTSRGSSSTIPCLTCGDGLGAMLYSWTWCRRSRCTNRGSSSTIPGLTCGLGAMLHSWTRCRRSRRPSRRRRSCLTSAWRLWGHGLPEMMWRHESARVMGSRWNGSNLMLKVAFGRGAVCTPLPALRGHRGGATFRFRASRLHRLWMLGVAGVACYRAARIERQCYRACRLESA